MPLNRDDASDRDRTLIVELPVLGVFSGNGMTFTSESNDTHGDFSRVFRKPFPFSPELRLEDVFEPVVHVTEAVDDVDGGAETCLE